jgi:hypothetical protein
MTSDREEEKEGRKRSLGSNSDETDPAKRQAVSGGTDGVEPVVYAASSGAPPQTPLVELRAFHICI